MADLTALIRSAAEQAGVPPNLLLRLLQHESNLNPQAVSVNRGGSAPGSRDRGIAQINDYWHPEVTDQQASDPQFAIPWAAHYLAARYDECGSWSGAAQAYNSGSCSGAPAYAAAIGAGAGGAGAAAPAPGSAADQGGQAPDAPIYTAQGIGQAVGTAAATAEATIQHHLFGDMTRIDFVLLLVGVALVLIVAGAVA